MVCGVCQSLFGTMDVHHRYNVSRGTIRDFYDSVKRVLKDGGKA
jgi:hypothetical protein